MSVPFCLLSLPTVKAFGCILPISTSNDGFSATGVQFFGGGVIRAVAHLFFNNLAGFCRIWNDKNGQSRIFKLTNFTNFMCKKITNV